MTGKAKVKSDAAQREVWIEVLDHLVASKQIVVESDGPVKRYCLGTP